MPTGKFAISGLRVFGKGDGVRPLRSGIYRAAYRERQAQRLAQMAPAADAYAYNIYYRYRSG